MMGQIGDIEYHHAGRYKVSGNSAVSGDTNSTVIEEEEEEEDEVDDIEQEEIINQVKIMEAKRMSKTDKLVQELKLRQLEHHQPEVVNENVMIDINLNEINLERQPSSPVTNPVEYIRTPPPPPPPGIAGVDHMGNVVQAPQGPNQTYANPNPGY
eukprot:CAMPEP_0201564088 /NCGR_PEP_ID=MMETSP0190_2-20130828/1967_1 /ASSEMBLY_ACC=CAM_ASM_000263 /TAXON_ID=37353 /ORGANISM="Rosalina sp." /LENGTH=154 /DNA_ID=CAMNT_0047979751 /DNA_START=382 /DNA_END=846 /DNA_ORIENTATION=-